MLLNLKEILAPAKLHGFAVGAFNVTESTMFKAIVEEAEVNHAPTIIAVSPNEVDYCDEEQYLYFVERLWRSENPFALHYDHGKTYDGCVKAIQMGFTSVMFDGSYLPYEENVAITNDIVKVAHACGVSVEGEIGRVGETRDFDAGVVDNMIYSTVEDAIRFTDATNVDALAISIGTVHGVLPKGYVPTLQVERIKEIAAAISTPLVMHGSSFTPSEEIAKACRNGINKVNVSSEFKSAYYQSIKEFVLTNPAWAVSPTVVTKGAVEEVRQVVRTKISLFGSADKACYYSMPRRRRTSGNLHAAD